MQRAFKQTFASQMEADTFGTLAKTGMRFIYAASFFDVRLQNGDHITFRPDFLVTGLRRENSVGFTEVKIGGKALLLEPHCGVLFDNNFINKLHSFMQSDDHNKNFLVVITERKYRPYVELKLAGCRLKTTEICDQMWYIERGGLPTQNRWKMGGLENEDVRLKPHMNPELAIKLKELRRSFDPDSLPASVPAPVAQHFGLPV